MLACPLHCESSNVITHDVVGSAAVYHGAPQQSPLEFVERNVECDRQIEAVRQILPRRFGEKQIHHAQAQRRDQDSGDGSSASTNEPGKLA